jgi:hypothetical protein
MHGQMLPIQRVAPWIIRSLSVEEPDDLPHFDLVARHLRLTCLRFLYQSL